MGWLHDGLTLWVVCNTLQKAASTGAAGYCSPAWDSFSDTIRTSLLRRASHDINTLLWKYLVGDEEEIQFLKGHARTIQVRCMLRPTWFQKGGNPYVGYSYINLLVVQRTDLPESLFHKVSFINCYKLCIWLGSETEGEIFFLICYHMTICVWQSHCVFSGSQGTQRWSQGK